MNLFVPFLFSFWNSGCDLCPEFFFSKILCKLRSLNKNKF